MTIVLRIEDSKDTGVLKGLSADLECAIFNSNGSCSFWNKADCKRIKRGKLSVDDISHNL